MYLSAPTTNFLQVRFLEKFESLKRTYFCDIIKNIRKKNYDYVFVINAAVFPEYFLKEMASICDKSNKILYSWDSIKVYPKALQLHKYFDCIYSFDSEDVKKYKQMSFLPLFYYEDLCKTDTKKCCEYDFSFVGFGHTERYKFINCIKQFAEENGYSYYFKLYLPSKLHFIRGKYFKKIFSEASINDFIYKSVSHETIGNITRNSKIIVDIELSTQSGLTMRTIETHGMHKKLVTTNAFVKQYDFYNSNNILIVDRENPVIPNSFVESEYVELPKSLYDKYTLTNWIKTIFEMEEKNEN